MEELCKICETEALELNLKNEEEFLKRTNRGRAFQAEWKA